MKIKDAIDWIDIARMGYICDPNECGLEKGGDPCKVFHCDEIHNALVMAMDALEIADRLEQNHMNVLDRFCKDDCNCEELEDCKRDSDLCVSAILWKDGYNQALADIRGDTE